MIDNRNWHQLFGPFLNPNNRIRAVIAWDGCPAGSVGKAPIPVATDLELLLVKDNAVIDGSQTVNHVTEGFDITIPATYLHP